MIRTPDHDEKNISQKPAVEVLRKLGYQYLTPQVARDTRGNLYNVLLRDVLIEKLVELNSYHYKGQSFKFGPKNIEKAVEDLDEPLTDGLVKTNEKIYDSLMLGRSYEEILPDGGKRSFPLKYVDWKNPQNNVYHVVEEFTAEKENGRGNARSDIVLFVNGIPFAIIECKKASIELRQGISQIIRNQGNDYIPQLFKYSQIVMATNKNETKYATCYTPSRFWSVWKEENEAWLQSQLSKTVSGRLPTNQDKNIISLFHPKRLLEITQYFVLFDKDLKKIARYQQYFAVKEIIETIKETDENGNRQSGVVWHTQGSGKSLTMVMLAKFLLSELDLYHPKVVVVTDRINLDKQINQTFNHTRLKARRATTGKHLVSLINDDGADIITSLVHKFDTAARDQKPIESRDIFILVDESHRTQYGELHIKMKQVFPNACYLGFTGTPLMRKEKNTMIKFGRLIHKYTIADGVEDKIIVPLLYEGRMVEQTVNRKAIDNRLEMITRDLDEKRKNEVMAKWSRFEKIASSDQRIGLIAYDINEHFLKNYKTKGSQFKGMLATNSRPEAVKYLNYFTELDDLNAAVVISSPDQREGYEAVGEDSQNTVQKFWDKMMERYGNEENYEDSIKDEFVNGADLDLLIVVDKLLTGFDAPRATVMYVDKLMKEHTLLQAIARVNRLYDGKDYGIIIDYRGLLEKLDEALEMYSGSGLENYETEDLKGALYDVINIVGSLRQHYTNLVNLFLPIRSTNDLEEYEVLLGNEELRKQFYDCLSKFGRYLKLALESERVYHALGQDEIEKYKRALRFYQELRRNVKIRYSETVDYQEYEAQMQKLMDNYIAAEDLIQITNPVDILDKKGFEEELERLGSPRAKADAIRTRMTRSINQNWNENPLYYKNFSDLVAKTLQDYKDKRISEKDYFKRMRALQERYQEGIVEIDYPSVIKNEMDAQAFYGVISGTVKEAGASYGVGQLGEETLGGLSLAVEEVVSKHTKVDWHDNRDVHNRMDQELEDLFFEFAKANSIEPDFELIDKLLSELRSVALRRY